MEKRKESLADDQRKQEKRLQEVVEVPITVNSAEADDGAGNKKCAVFSSSDSKNNEDRCLSEERSRSRKSRKHKDSRSRSSKRDEDKSERKRSYTEKEKRIRKRRQRRSSSSSQYRSRSRSRGRKNIENCRTRRRKSYSSSDDSSDFRGTGMHRRREYNTNYDSYKAPTPNKTIMVRGLSADLKESDILAEVSKCGLTVKDVRVIRNHETGASRGFAFVEFNSVMDASRWMEMKKGVLHISDKCEAKLIYSFPKNSSPDSSSTEIEDWLCVKCNGRNFKRRLFCYKCYAAKPLEEDQLLVDNTNIHQTHSSTTIVLSNLDVLTTEETVLQALQLKPISWIPIKSLKIAREPKLYISTGECYLEANNVEDAHALLLALSQETLEIDGRTVTVDVGKTIDSAERVKNANAGKAALEAAQWTNSLTTFPHTANCNDYTAGKMEMRDIETLAQESAKLYAKTTEDYESYLKYYRQYYKQEITNGVPGNHTESIHSSFTSFPLDKPELTNQNHSLHPSYPVGFETTACADNRNSEAQTDAPGTSRQYLYDETSGYYFDPISKMYYNATTNYIYDAEKQQFLYWSPDEEKYIDATTDIKPDQAKSDIKEKPNKTRDKTVASNDQTTVAKRIVKEMNKWEKALNVKKPSVKHLAIESNSSNVLPRINSAAEGLAYNATEDSSIVQNLEICDDSLNNWRTICSPLDTANVDKVIDFRYSDDIIDESKLLCLLCKRRFISNDALQKHVELSNLHKQNLMETLEQVGHDKPESSSLSYRDRAKERRETYGPNDECSGNTLKDHYLKRKEEIQSAIVQAKLATNFVLESDNKGNRMLQKMGWKVGQGLGINNQGIVDIIKPERTTGKLGLGMRLPRFNDHEMPMDPKVKTHELTLHRYNELD